MNPLLRLSSLLSSPRVRRGRRRLTSPPAEVLEDRLLLSAQALYDYELVGRTSGGNWWSGGGYDSGAGSLDNRSFTTWASSINWQHVRFGDFDANGLDDVAGWNPATGQWWVSVNNRTSMPLTLAGGWSQFTTWTDVAVVDLAPTGDRGVGGHRDDIVGRSADGSWWAAVSNGDGTFRNVRLTGWNPLAGWTDVQFLDVNRDGATDIVGRTAGSWWAAMSQVNGSGEGLTYRNVHLATWNWLAGWHDVHVADNLFANDRAALIARTAGGAWWGLDFAANGTATTKYLGTWNQAAGWRDVMLADFKPGDNGRPELLGRTASGTWWLGSWNGSQLVNTHVGGWNETAGWHDVKLIPPVGSGGASVIGRTVDGALWRSKLTPDGRAMATSYMGRWDASANWRDVQVAIVTGQPVNGNDHYDSLLSSANLDVAYSLRSQQEINQFSNESEIGVDNASVTYDGAIDGARVVIPSGRQSLAIDDTLRLPFTPGVVGDGTNEISIQWETRFGAEYVNTDLDGLLHHKAFRFDYQGSEYRRVEFRTWYNYQDATSAALTSIRTYGLNRIGGDGSPDPLRVPVDDGGYNWQPGGDTAANMKESPFGLADHGQPGKPFLIRPETWVRFTASVTFTGGEMRMRVWMADEFTDPMLVIADPSDPNKGFLIDSTEAGVAGLSMFSVIMNTSQTRTGGPDLRNWVRNVVVFRDATVPLGGRPIG